MQRSTGPPFLRAAVGADPQVRRDIETAHQLGVPLSYYYGVRSRETLHLGGVSVEVPDWLAVDRMLLELWQAWLDDLCPTCGAHMSEHKGRTWRDYQGHLDVTCPMAEARERYEVDRAHRRGEKDAKPDFQRWTTVVHALPDRVAAMAEHVKRLLT